MNNKRITFHSCAINGKYIKMMYSRYNQTWYKKITIITICLYDDLSVSMILRQYLI